ncbi:MAG: glycosyltransferase family 4 protein [Chloroflexi bacterium]|nr:glycosyltransferase family 4 protein [Chloroflexota bacterium]
MRSLLLAASFPPALGGIETLLYQTNRRLAEPPLVLAPAPAASSASWLPPGRHQADDDLPVGVRRHARARGIPAGTGPHDLASSVLVASGLSAPADAIRVLRVRVDLAGRLAYRPLWGLHPSLHYLQTFWRPALQATASWQPRVIQAGHIYLAPLAWLLARRRGLPFVVYAYGQEVWRGGRPMGRGLLDARLRGGALRAADRVFVPGAFTANLLADWHVAPDRTVAVPYGAEPRPRPDRLRSSATSLTEGAARPPVGGAAGVSMEGVTLLTVARLIPRKGIDTVIRAMRSLPPNVEYRVVGAGPDAPRLRELAFSEGVGERVHFLGRLNDRALADEYRRCSIFVLPARRTITGDLEGYGLVYFEAAAWGRPVIAGRSGGEVDAVVDGRTGVLVDGDSPEQLGATLAALLSDPARMAALGAAGRHRVETTHNWPAAAAVVDATLAELSQPSISPTLRSRMGTAR